MNSILLPQPTPGVIAALQAVSDQPQNPTNSSLAATAPAQSSGSYGPVKQLPDNFITTIVSQQAVLAANLTDRERINYGVVDGAAGATLQQLSQPGQSLKPGSGEFIQKLMAQNPNLPFQVTASPVLMTGNAGVTTPAALVTNTAAQVSAVNNSIVSATNGLTSSGVITGAESPTQVSGVIMAASLAGTAAVASILRNPQTVASAVGNPSSLIGSAITAGTFAGGLADRVTSGISGVAASISSLPGAALNSLSSGAASAINGITGGISTVFASGTGILRSAFTIAEQSFGKLKAGVPNVLGGLPQNVDFQQSKTQTAVRDYEIATENLLNAEDLLGQATNQYSIQSSAENLTKIRLAEAKVSAAKQALSAASQNLITGSTVSGSVNAPGFQQVSMQSIGTLATAATSGLLNNPNQGNTGVNAIPGGLSAFSNIISSVQTNVIGRITSAVTGIAGQVPGALAALSNPSLLVGGLVNGLASNLGGIGGSLARSVGNITGLFNQTGVPSTGALGAISGSIQSAAAGLTSSISSLLGSIGNSPGQVKVATIATNTYAKQNAVVSSTLNSALDPKVPPPSFDIVTPSYSPDIYQINQSSAQNAVKELVASRRIIQFNLADLNARYTQSKDNGLLVQIQLAQQDLLALDTKLAAAQANYSRVVGGQ